MSVLRRVFDFGYADIEDRRSPAEKLKMLKVQKPDPDPYTLAEALAIVDDSRKHYGESYGNYVEFQFFAGTRPSEAIALTWRDVDLHRGHARISKARVMARDKARTKTARSRKVELCARAAAALRGQFELTGDGGEHVFCADDGGPFHDLQTPWRRWREAHKRLRMQYREPYHTRHTYATLALMAGVNPNYVAKQMGNSPRVVFKHYADWIEQVDNGGNRDRINAAFGWPI